jgi:tetratricopeptide (TPR) repeat protein
VVSCVTTGKGDGLSLLEAIEQSAEKIAEELPPSSRVAIVAFESENNNLSDFIMEELTGFLVNLGIEVADRQNLEYVYKELDFQMSGNVSDETAQSIGKFLGAQFVITGQLTNIGGSYRYSTNVIHVEKATRDNVVRLSIQNNREMQRTITALANQTTAVKTANYGISKQTRPTTAGSLLDRGILFASRGEYEIAIIEFTEAITLEPDLIAAYMLRARALRASASFVTDTEENFSDINTVSVIGQQTSAEKIEIFQRAIEDYTQAIRLESNNEKAYISRGSTYNAIADFDRAIADFNQAIRLNPDYDGAYINRGNAYHGKGNYDSAINDYNQAIRIKPNNPMAYTNRGVEYSVKGDYDRAIADYNQAIRIDPNHANAYSSRGNAYYKKGDYDRAIADFSRAIRIYPNFAHAYFNRGIVYFNKGDYDLAIADYDQAIRLNLNTGVVYYNRGFSYFKIRNYNSAIADMNQAIQLNFATAYVYVIRGTSYHNRGDYSRAITDYETALRLDPNNTDAKTNLEIARQRGGR